MEERKKLNENNISQGIKPEDQKQKAATSSKFKINKVKLLYSRFRVDNMIKNSPMQDSKNLFLTSDQLHLF